MSGGAMMKRILGSIVFEILVSLGLVHWEYVPSGQPASKLPPTTKDGEDSGMHTIPAKDHALHDVNVPFASAPAALEIGPSQSCYPPLSGHRFDWGFAR